MRFTGQGVFDIMDICVIESVEFCEATLSRPIHLLLRFEGNIPDFQAHKLYSRGLLFLEAA